MPNIEDVGNKYAQIRKSRNNIVIGLFGTCFPSNWRDGFKKALDEKEILWYDPNKLEGWDEHYQEYMETEFRNLEQDDIILFPITDETWGTGSLGETGYSATKAMERAINSPHNQRVIFYIAPDVSKELKDKNPESAKESKRGRSLVMNKLKGVHSPNVIVVDSLDKMLEACLKYSEIAKLEKNATKDFYREDPKEIASCNSELLKTMLKKPELGEVLLSAPSEYRDLFCDNINFTYFCLENQDNIETIKSFLDLPIKKFSTLIKHPEVFDKLAQAVITQNKARESRRESRSSIPDDWDRSSL